MPGKIRGVHAHDRADRSGAGQLGGVGDVTVGGDIAGRYRRDQRPHPLDLDFGDRRHLQKLTHQRCDIGGLGLRDHVIAVQLDDSETRTELLSQRGLELLAHVRRLNPLRLHDDGGRVGRRYHDRTRQLTPRCDDRGRGHTPPDAAVVRGDEMGVDFAVEQFRRDIGPGPVDLLGFRFGGIGVIRVLRSQFRDLEQIGRIESDCGVEQYECAHEFRSSLGEMHCDGAPVGMSDDEDRSAGMGVEQCGQAIDLSSDVPRRCPRRTAVTDQIGRVYARLG